MTYVVDAMLGRLARFLRALGEEVLFEPALADERLAALSREPGRLLITRDTRLAGRGDVGAVLLLEENDPRAQIKTAARALGLAYDPARALTRCLECGTCIEDLPREQARGRVPDHVFATRERFTHCPGCARVYWEGTHVAKLAAELEAALRDPPQTG